MRDGLVAALDIGTGKICCFVAKDEGDGALRVVGIGHQVSRGLRNGVIVDMEAAEHAIRAAVHNAEQMAGETIRGVVANLSGGQPESRSIDIEMAIDGHEISDADLKRVLAEGRGVNGYADRTVIHALPVGYAIDGARGIRDPRGMCGDRLGVRMHVITAARGPVRNLVSCVARCHLEIDALVLSPYAAGLACLVGDELDLGATCIDMGAGTTSVSVFRDGEMVFADTIPVGGQHVTNDLARGLTTPVADAERLKTLYGHAIATAADDKEMIDIPQVGEGESASPNHVPRAALIGIVRPRIEETLELVRDRLEENGFDKAAGRRVVLTGGASQLAGVRELAAQILNKQVRLGRPIALKGLAESTRGPAFATCAGLLAYSANLDAAAPIRDRGQARETAGRLARFGHWFRENF